MWRNVFLLAIRKFRKQSIFTIINVVGLSIGISAALVIYLLVRFEYSYDQFHLNKDRIYRVVSQIDYPEMKIENSGVPIPLAAAARKEIPELERVSHFLTYNPMKITFWPDVHRKPKELKKPAQILITDPDYFGVIQYQWLKGSATAALREPYQLVLTEGTARSYFPGRPLQEILGETVMMDDSIKAQVTGIVADLPGPTDFDFKVFLSYATLEHSWLKEYFVDENWNGISSSSQMFVLLNKGAQPEAVEKKLAALREKYRQHDPNGSSDKDNTKHLLQPLNDLHFNAHYSAFQHRQASRRALSGLIAIAAFLLLLGCINFINLTTAQATSRAKEIGVRKTLGGSRRQLIGQFMGETFLMTCLATIISVLLLPLLLKIFHTYLPAEINNNSLYQYHVGLYLMILVLAVSFLSGYYPALAMSSFLPVTALKKQALESNGSKRQGQFRKYLTVTQFMIAQFLLLATLVVSKQIYYSLNMDLGFKKDAIVKINLPYSNLDPKEQLLRKERFAEALRSVSGIEKVSIAGPPPSSTSTSTTSMTYHDGKRTLNPMIEIRYADTNYFSLYGMKLLAGRNLQAGDSIQQLVINASFARLLGFSNPADAIGKMIDYQGKTPVIGVIADFHTKSTHEPIKPLAFRTGLEQSYTVHLALSKSNEPNGSWESSLKSAAAVFQSVYPTDDFDYSFVDDDIARFYQTEKNMSGLLSWASGLCLLISSLGLLGLVIFTTNARAKEVGIRKVLGASISQLVILLSKDFLLLVCLAFIIATPIAWLVMDHWLQQFAYRTSINWWVFAGSGSIMFVLALLTLSLRTVKTALENPIIHLKAE